MRGAFVLLYGCIFFVPAKFCLEKAALAVSPNVLVFVDRARLSLTLIIASIKKIYVSNHYIYECKVQNIIAIYV